MIGVFFTFLASPGYLLNRSSYNILKSLVYLAAETGMISAIILIIKKQAVVKREE